VVDCNKMNYEKCFGCVHSTNWYCIVGGLTIACNITGNFIDVDKCKECE